MINVENVAQNVRLVNYKDELIHISLNEQPQKEK